MLIIAQQIIAAAAMSTTIFLPMVSTDSTVIPDNKLELLSTGNKIQTMVVSYNTHQFGSWNVVKYANQLSQDLASVGMGVNMKSFTEIEGPMPHIDWKLDRAKLWSDLDICNQGVSTVWIYQAGVVDTQVEYQMEQAYGDTGDMPHCDKPVMVFYFAYSECNHGKIVENSCVGGNWWWPNDDHNMLHDYGHMIENVLWRKVPCEFVADYHPTPSYFEDVPFYTGCTEEQNKYAFVNTARYFSGTVEMSGTAMAGDVHFPPNAKADRRNNDYDYANKDYVTTEINGIPEQINCDAWGCNQRGYHLWWMAHLHSDWLALIP